MTLVRRHPLTVFAVLACLFGWSIWIAALLGAPVEPDNMPLGPLAAAAIVTACQGRAELRGWGRALLAWRASPAWYAVAVLTPVALVVACVLVNHALGAPLPTGAQLSDWTGVPATFAVMLVMVGIGEEAGWSAFAAPVLLRRHGLIGAWLVLGAVRILWHLPLLLTGEMPLVLGVAGNLGFQLLLLQLLRASGGRWTLAAVFHATINAVGGPFFFTMVTGADKDRLGVLFGLVYLAAGLLTLLPLARSRSAGAVDPGLVPHR